MQIDAPSNSHDWNYTSMASTGQASELIMINAAVIDRCAIHTTPPFHIRAQPMWSHTASQNILTELVLLEQDSNFSLPYTLRIPRLFKHPVDIRGVVHVNQSKHMAWVGAGAKGSEKLQGDIFGWGGIGLVAVGVGAWRTISTDKSAEVSRWIKMKADDPNFTCGRLFCTYFHLFHTN